MYEHFLYPCKPDSLPEDSPVLDELDRDPSWVAELSSETGLIEGIVLKNLNSRHPISRHRCRQNPDWLKVKPAALIAAQREECMRGRQ